MILCNSSQIGRATDAATSAPSATIHKDLMFHYAASSLGLIPP
jgi:hypothetical protein